MGFELPWSLLLFAVTIPLLLVIRRSERISGDILGRLRSRPPRRRRFAIRCALAMTFAGSLVIVAASPYTEPRATGDFIFLSDTSRSMEARNSCAEPTYLDRSKDVIRDVLNGVPEARFGIVAFDRLAFPVTQMTYDHSYLDEVLSNGLFIGMSYRATGTDLGNALSVVAQKKRTLPDLYGNVHHVILLSDGYLDVPEWQGELAQPFNDLRQADISVLAVGIGNQAETPIPITTQDEECRKELIEVDRKTVRIPFKPDVLKRIAVETHGEYFAEGQTEDLIGFIRKALTVAPANTSFNEEQRTGIGWVFLIPATVGLFGFYLS